MMSVRDAMARPFRPVRDHLRAGVLVPLRRLPGSILAADEVVRTVTPFTPLLGLARSLLAAATLATLVATPHAQLFFRSVNYPDGVTCDRPLSVVSLFCLFRGDAGWIAVTIAIVVLLAVLSGFLPAVTALPHWWVAWSFNMTSPIPDGGDQVSAVLTLLLLPLLLGDRRLNHWQVDTGYASRAIAVKALAYSALVLIWIQVCVIYFHAAVGKFAVEEWTNGTVLWYWFHDPTFAPAEPLRSVMLWIVASGLGAAVLAYGSLLTELLLAFALVANQRLRSILLIVGVLFHLGIAVSFGLWSFSVTMTAALLLYLIRPRLEPATLRDSPDPSTTVADTGKTGTDALTKEAAVPTAPPTKGDDLHAHDRVPTL
jgi:antimicrobial peptide system SdpB family protein